MRIHNIYVDDNGESHWRNIEVEWAEGADADGFDFAVLAAGVVEPRRDFAQRHHRVGRLDACAREDAA